MGDALRRLFLSLGVALGLAAGQPDPSLRARAYEDGGFLAVAARVDDAFAPGALELVEAGTRVALRYAARLEPSGGGEPGAQETRSISYNLRSARYDVALEGGRTASLVDPQAARDLVAEPSRLVVCRAAQAREGDRIVVRVEIGIIDSRGDWHDAPVLWNYFGPRAVLAIGPAEEGSK